MPGADDLNDILANAMVGPIELEVTPTVRGRDGVTRRVVPGVPWWLSPAVEKEPAPAPPPETSPCKHPSSLRLRDPETGGAACQCGEKLWRR